MTTIQISQDTRIRFKDWQWKHRHRNQELALLALLDIAEKIDKSKE